jgi:exodeoxyribonuclease V gamma subunit
MSLHLHRSNRTEALVAALIDVVRTPLPDPFTAECIVVQGRGMERWLEMQLAAGLGVWGNPTFPFPRRIVAHVLDAFVGPHAGAPDVFDAPTLTWAIAALLPDHLDEDAFAPLRRYLGGDTDGTRLLALSRRIAATFDQYAVFRPAMTQAWERGRESDWQARLWRALVGRYGATHVAARVAALAPALAAAASLPPDLPPRVSVFGVSSLPPLYLDVLTALARLADVHLFILSPSDEYWGEVRSRREILRALRDDAIGGPAAEARLHLSEGHPLLASLGRLGRDFQHLLEAGGDYVDDPEERYADPGTTTMLATLQSDILHLRHRRAGDPECPPVVADAADRSIAVHACHGPMREVEVLHDQLLALLDDDPTLQPHEIIVMSPAIDEYAPFVEAVFGSGHDGRPAIPHRVADRGARAIDPTYDAFCRMLDVLDQRCTASQVMDLLAVDGVRERFGLTPADLELVRGWVQTAGIRWGIDEQHRVALAYPPIREHTWRFGLDRLLLGCAMEGDGATLYGGVLPHDDLEGAETAVLGQAATFAERLFALHDTLRPPRPLHRWAADLAEALAAMVATSSATADGHLRIRRALDVMAERAAAVNFTVAVPRAVVRTMLDEELRDTRVPHGFLGGGVTFCALVPMRSIPFRVVALLGMSDDAFPRAERALGFDRMAEARRPGDRNARDDDRYTFLEAVLSARERLLVTYVGQSIRDNAPLPPSVVVSELFDVLESSFQPPPERRTVRAHVEVRHPLQSFSATYFRPAGDRRLFSYAAAACAGARAMQLPVAAPTPLITAPLPAVRPAATEISIDAFAAFLEHPIRGFLREQLGLYLGDDLVVLDDREPVDLAGLAEWSVGDALLERAVAIGLPAHVDAAVQATGALAPGRLGRLQLAGVLPQVVAIAARAAHLRTGAALEPVAVDLTVGDLRLTGLLDGLWPRAQVRHQFSRLERRSEVRFWVRHLLLLATAPADYPRATAIVGRIGHAPAVCRFGDVADPHAMLATLGALYVRGQTEPLTLFPNASRTYAAVLQERGASDHARALDKARQRFDPGDGVSYGDLDDPYVRQLWAEHDPFVAAAEDFSTTAVALFGPLLAHREIEA